MSQGVLVFGLLHTRLQCALLLGHSLQEVEARHVGIVLLVHFNEAVWTYALGTCIACTCSWVGTLIHRTENGVVVVVVVWSIEPLIIHITLSLMV